MAAFGLPKSNEEEKQRKKKPFRKQPAMRMEIPFQVMQSCMQELWKLIRAWQKR